MLSVREKVIAVIQYILFYYMLLIHGSVYFSLEKYHDLMLGGLLLLDGVLAVWTLYRWKKKQECFDKHYVIFLCAVFAALLISAVSNGFSLGLFSILNIMGRLAFVYLVYHLDETRAANRMVRLCGALALISLGFYAVLRTRADVLVSFMPKYIYGEDYGSYALPVFSFINGLTSRNCGIYTEPGLFQIVLGSMLFLLLQGRNKIFFHKAEQFAHIIITLLALITTKSTTGYIALFIIFGLFLFERNKGDLKKFYYWVLGIGSVGVAVDLLRKNNSLIYQHLFYKVSLIGTNIGSGKDRVNCIKADLEIASKYPLGAGYKIYNSLWEDVMQKDGMSGLISSCAGLTKYLATAGIHTVLVLLGGYGYFLWKNYKSVFARIAYILFFFNTTLAQPDIVYMVMIFVLLCKDQEQ